MTNEKCKVRIPTPKFKKKKKNDPNKKYIADWQDCQPF